MMKSFFKKLAFVMALAMVVSAAAPAASASAAVTGVSIQGTKTIVDTYELAKVGATVDFSFQGAPKDWKTTFKWESSNEAVATVDKAGVVTAVAEGTAIISITAGADGSYYEEVEVTVKAAKKAEAFTVAQTTTTKFEMTFPAKKNVKAEDVAVVMMINDVEAPIPVKAVEVKDNVATVELFSSFVDATKYTVTYAGETKEFTASVGDIARVSFEYWTEEEGDNVAYVTSENEGEEYITKLVYKLYDANNVDVTKAYNEDDLTISYELASENEDYDIMDNELTFFKAGVAVVNMTVLWTNDDEDGEEISKSYTGVVVGTKLPAIAHTQLKGGFINVNEYDLKDEAKEAFTSDDESFFWKDNAFKNSWILNDEGALQFAALVKDNRGNTVVSGINKYGEEYEEDEDENLVYPYGYFKFVSSNPEVIDVSWDATLQCWDAGTASIITYFVDTTGEEEKEVFVGATKITVKPERYVATYTINKNALTTSTDAPGWNFNVLDAGESNDKQGFVLVAYDQYGDDIALKNEDGDITVKATSSSSKFPDELKEVDVENSEDLGCTSWWCGSSKGKVHYHINFDGDDYKEYVGDSTSKTIQYKVTVDDEENEKLTSGATTIKLTVKNTNDYAAALRTTAGPEKYYYSIIMKNDLYSGNNIDLVLKNHKNFKNENGMARTAVKDVYFKLWNLANTGSLPMKYVDAANIIELTENQTTGDAGKIYYEVTAPKKAYEKDENDNLIKKNWSYELGSKYGNPVFYMHFNSVDDNNNLLYAEPGTYKITFKYVKNGVSNNKLSVLESYSFNVKNSQEAPKFSKYDDELGNKTSETIGEDSYMDIIQANMVFTYNGEELDWDDVEVTAELGKDVIISENQIRVNDLTFKIPVEGNDGTFYYTEKVRVGKYIKYEEE